MVTKMSLPGMDLMKGVGLGPLNIGNVLDTMGFVKKAWGAMNAPSAFMPTIDVEELKKRIVDLQAVEQWLVMNLGMIQSSIQALEIQRATIETLKGVSKGFMPGMPASLGQNPGVSPEAMASTLFNVPSLQSPMPVADRHSATVAPKPIKKANSKSKSAARTSAAQAGDAGLGATTWLEFLQSQFNQVTQAAMSGASLKAAGKSAQAVAKKVTRQAANSVMSGSTKPAVKSAIRKGTPTHGTSPRSTRKSGLSK
jgi:hypothetical protein